MGNGIWDMGKRRNGAADAPAPTIPHPLFPVPQEPTHSASVRVRAHPLVQSMCVIGRDVDEAKADPRLIRGGGGFRPQVMRTNLVRVARSIAIVQGEAELV